MGDANKLLLPLGGRPLVVHTVAALRTAPIGDVIVVTGYDRTAVAQVLEDNPVQVVHNADYASGMASSIRRGVAAASPHTDGVMICLGDLPLVRPGTLRQLCDRFVAASPPAIVLPVCEGHRGHPVLFDGTFQEELLALRGDTGARSVIRAHDTVVVEVEVDDPGIFRDVDTQAGYDALVRAVEREAVVTGAGCGPQWLRSRED